MPLCSLTAQSAARRIPASRNRSSCRPVSTSGRHEAEPDSAADIRDSVGNVLEDGEKGQAAVPSMSARRSVVSGRSRMAWGPRYRRDSSRFRHDGREFLVMVTRGSWVLRQSMIACASPLSGPGRSMDPISPSDFLGPSGLRRGGEELEIAFLSATIDLSSVTVSHGRER